MELRDWLDEYAWKTLALIAATAFLAFIAVFTVTKAIGEVVILSRRKG